MVESFIRESGDSSHEHERLCSGKNYWSDIINVHFHNKSFKKNRPKGNAFIFFLCCQMNPKPRAWTGKPISKHGYRTGRFHQTADAQSEFGWSPIRTRRNSDAASEMSCNWWHGGLGALGQVQFIVHNFHSSVGRRIKHFHAFITSFVHFCCCTI